jgi:hypothetical protein
VTCRPGSTSLSRGSVPPSVIWCLHAARWQLRAVSNRQAIRPPVDYRQGRVAVSARRGPRLSCSGRAEQARSEGADRGGAGPDGHHLQAVLPPAPTRVIKEPTPTPEQHCGAERDGGNSASARGSQTNGSSGIRWPIRQAANAASACPCPADSHQSPPASITYWNLFELGHLPERSSRLGLAWEKEAGWWAAHRLSGLSPRYPEGAIPVPRPGRCRAGRPG